MLTLFNYFCKVCNESEREKKNIAAAAAVAATGAVVEGENAAQKTSFNSRKVNKIEANDDSNVKNNKGNVDKAAEETVTNWR